MSESGSTAINTSRDMPLSQTNLLGFWDFWSFVNTQESTLCCTSRAYNLIPGFCEVSPSESYFISEATWYTKLPGKQAWVYLSSTPSARAEAHLYLSSQKLPRTVVFPKRFPCCCPAYALLDGWEEAGMRAGCFPGPACEDQALLQPPRKELCCPEGPGRAALRSFWKAGERRAGRR